MVELLLSDDGFYLVRKRQEASSVFEGEVAHLGQNDLFGEAAALEEHGSQLALKSLDMRRNARLRISKLSRGASETVGNSVCFLARCER